MGGKGFKDRVLDFLKFGGVSRGVVRRFGRAWYFGG